MKQRLLFLLLLFPHLVLADSLIPAGTVNVKIVDIQDTALELFTLILPVIVSVVALQIGIRLIKRFLNETSFPQDDDPKTCPACEAVLDDYDIWDVEHCPECHEPLDVYH